MISIVAYQSAWPAEFHSLAADLCAALGSLAGRIDHIGSTAVPGLAAKDIIDIQVTVADLSEPLELALTGAGYRRVLRIGQDHVPPGWKGDEAEWRKWFFKPAAGQRAVHVHVRMAGRANQRYPLLFRDYLRANPNAAAAYARVKIELAKHHPADIEAFCDIKDPVCDIIMCAAEAWATDTKWEISPAGR